MSRIIFFLIFLFSLTACTNTYTTDPHFYTLSQLPHSSDFLKVQTSEHIIEIAEPTVGLGLESQAMWYTLKSYQIQKFANSQWIDTPAKMVSQLLKQTLEESHYYKEVTNTYPIKIDRRLETQIVSLYQDFNIHPSHIFIKIKFTLIDTTTQCVIYNQSFVKDVPTDTDTPYGGVMSFNKTMAIILKNLANSLVLADQKFSLYVEQEKKCLQIP